MRVYAVGSAVAVGVALVLLASCREPTQVTLELSTDLSCSSADPDPLDETSIYVGTPQEMAGPLSGLSPAAVTHGCMAGKDGRIGSIVVVPSGSDDERFALRVVAGRRSSDCTNDLLSGCIEARRTLGFVPHTPLFLPLALNETCENVVCPSAGDTCVDGACVPSDIVCSGDCTTPNLDAGLRDVAAIVDAIVPKDAISVLDVGLEDAITPLDASPVQTCNPSSWADGGAPTYTWHFDEATGTTTSEANKLLPDATLGGATFVPGSTLACKTALSDSGVTIGLGTSSLLASAAFRVEFFFQTTKPNTTILTLQDVSTQAKAWGLGVVGGNVTAAFCSGANNCANVVDSATVSDAAWHRVTLTRTAGGVVGLSVDGDVPTTASPSLKPATNGLLFLSFGGTMDELHFTASP